MKKSFNRDDVAALRALREGVRAASGAEIPKAKEPADMQPGDLIEGEGIYLGQYSPVDRDGNSLSKTFNVFAAPEDLPGETRNYLQTVGIVASLKDWHGHDGTHYATDKDLYAAIWSGDYNGGWIIPTSDILFGNDGDGKNTMANNLMELKETGALKGTFKMAGTIGTGYPHWYWSCTEHNDDPRGVRFARFSEGVYGWLFKHNYALSCRPVRLVLAPA